MSAERNLAPIRAKLRGANTGDATINSVPGQVDKLIKEATSSDNLVRDCEFRCWDADVRLSCTRAGRHTCRRCAIWLAVWLGFQGTWQSQSQ